MEEIHLKWLYKRVNTDFINIVVLKKVNSALGSLCSWTPSEKYSLPESDLGLTCIGPYSEMLFIKSCHCFFSIRQSEAKFPVVATHFGLHCDFRVPGYLLDKMKLKDDLWEWIWCFPSLCGCTAWGHRDPFQNNFPVDDRHVILLFCSTD